MSDKENILYKLKNDLNYIPTLSDLKLVGEIFTIGEAPIFKIRLQDLKDKKLISNIEKEASNIRPGGLLELYQQLELYGECSSYSEANIYYVCYTLANNNIIFDLEGFKYRNKLFKKAEKIRKLLKELKNNAGKGEY